MKFTYVFLLSLLGTTCFSSSSWAQAIGPTQDINTSQEGVIQTPDAETTEDDSEPSSNPYAAYNENSLNPLPEPHVLFRRRVWREMYLKERQNKPFFARDKEITKFIIEGVKEGVLTPYTDELLTTAMTQEQFLEKLSLPKEEGLSAEEKALGFTDDTGWGDRETPSAPETTEEYFLPNEVTTLELMEDVIFDKVSSRLIYDIQTVKLIIPADKFPTGLRRTVGTFKYKDLAAYFDSKPKEAVWINVKNNAGNIKLTEAFELRLFGSRIVKVENPDDATIEDIYNKSPEAALLASQQLEEELRELEYFLWED